MHNARYFPPYRAHPLPLDLQLPRRYRWYDADRHVTGPRVLETAVTTLDH